MIDRLILILLLLIKVIIFKILMKTRRRDPIVQLTRIETKRDRLAQPRDAGGSARQDASVDQHAVHATVLDVDLFSGVFRGDRQESMTARDAARILERIHHNIALAADAKYR